MSCLLSVLRPVFYKLNQTFEAFRIFCSAAFCPTTTFTEVVLNEREFENAASLSQKRIEYVVVFHRAKRHDEGFERFTGDQFDE